MNSIESFFRLSALITHNKVEAITYSKHHGDSLQISLRLSILLDAIITGDDFGSAFSFFQGNKLLRSFFFIELCFFEGFFVFFCDFWLVLFWDRDVTFNLIYSFFIFFFSWTIDFNLFFSFFNLHLSGTINFNFCSSFFELFLSWTINFSFFYSFF